MIYKKEVIFKLTVNAYYDEKFDMEELKQKITDTLNIDHWDFEIEVVEEGED